MDKQGSVFNFRYTMAIRIDPIHIILQFAVNPVIRFDFMDPIWP